MLLFRDFGFIESLEGLRCLLDRNRRSDALHVALNARNGREKLPPSQSKIAMLLLIACFLTGVASAQVAISSPASGATVGSPVHVVASASSAHPITAMRIYLDGVSVFLGSAAQIDTSVAAASGSHLLVVQAWDSTGAVFKTSVTITVGTAPTSSQVVVSSPASGATVGSPIHVVASATSTSPILAMRIYLDGVSVFLGSTAQIDTSVAAASGSHLLVVQAWDSTGGVFKTPATVTVGAASPAPTPAPTPVPSNAIVFNEVQQTTGWLTCGACGNPGGTGTPPTYSMVRGITFPTLSGSSTQFNIGGGTKYANAYWFLEHPAMSAGISSLRYEFDIYIPAGMENAPQAIEFECQQRLNGFLYNFAWQAAYADGNQWRVFNYNTKIWENVGVPLQRFSPNTWHHVVAEYHNNSATHTTYHEALTIDGIRHALSVAHAATPVPVGNEFTNAFQLDLNVVPTPFQVFVDNMKITIVN